MTTDTTTCRMAKSGGNIITPMGRISYAQFLIDPQENQNGKLKYNLNLLVPKSSDLTLLKKQMAKVALEKLDGDKNRAKKFVEDRFLDPNNLPGGGKPMGDEFKDFVLIRATSENKPSFVYPNGKTIDDKDVKNELYSGRWGCASLNPYWFDVGTNKGVALGLGNIQLLDHDENIGVAIPKAEDEFGAVEGAEEDEAGSSVPDSDVDDMFA